MFMQPADVEGVLGQPNRIFGKGDHANWYYYAANGTQVSIRFMGDGLGEAEYHPVNGKSFSVAKITQELGGRNIYSILAERATQRFNFDHAELGAGDALLINGEDFPLSSCNLKKSIIGHAYFVTAVFYNFAASVNGFFAAVFQETNSQVCAARAELIF